MDELLEVLTGRLVAPPPPPVDVAGRRLRDLWLGGMPLERAAAPRRG